MRAALALVLLGVTGQATTAELRDIEVERRDGRIFVQSDTFIDAPVGDVFEVLADYEGFHRISSVFEETRYLERDAAGNGTVYTRARGCVAFFCTSIERVERLTVEFPHSITAVALAEQSDVRFSHAQWRLDAEKSGTRVVYELEMEPSFWIPPVIGPWLLKQSLARRGARAAQRVEEIALAGNAEEVRAAAP